MFYSLGGKPFGNFVAFYFEYIVGGYGLSIMLPLSMLLKFWKDAVFCVERLSISILKVNLDIFCLLFCHFIARPQLSNVFHSKSQKSNVFSFFFSSFGRKRLAKICLRSKSFERKQFFSKVI